MSNYVGGTATNPVLQGPQSFTLTPRTNFVIYIQNAGTGIPHQISPPPGTNTASGQSPLTDFYAPRAVTVNTNIRSPYFGTIYVANSLAVGSDGIRGTQRGVYALNSDFTDAFGYGHQQHASAGSQFAGQ